ncbi:MAG: hypothetical protein J6P98_01640, partial [Clostridia bacterium]|nr:hypothetical protein [Clostridia bacterium]
MKRFTIIILICLLALAALPVNAERSKSLIVNGDFEQYGASDLFPDGWTCHSYEAEYENDPENASVRCEEQEGHGSVVYMSAKAEDDVALYQEIAVEPSSLYRLTCQVKTRGVENGNGANIALRDIIAASEGVYGDTDWTELELVGRTGPAQTYMIVSCRIGGYGMVAKGEAWFDNFTAEKIDSTDGEVIPFFDGNVSDDEPVEKSGGVDVVVVGIIAAAAVAVAAGVFFAVRGKKNGEPATESAPRSDKPLPPVSSYTKDKARKLTGMEAIRGRSFFDTRGDTLPGPTDTKLHFTKRDWIYVLVLTVVYAAVSLIRLGTLKFPTSYWEANTGDSVRIEFGRTVKISEIWQNSGISHINYKLVTDDGAEIAMDQKSRSEYGNMFRWAKLSNADIAGAGETTGLTLTVMGGDTGRRDDPDLVLNELVIFDENGDKVACTSADAPALFDEQDTVPAYASCYNGMYFDELYHGRTALEHINNQ